MSMIRTEKIILYLVTFLPIGIMIGQSVSTSIIILIGLLFLFHSYRYNDWKWLNQKFIKLLIILYIYLIINLIFSQDHLNSALRNLGFVRYILLIAAINYFLNKDENKKIFIRYWAVIIFVLSIDIYFEFIFQQNLLGFKSHDYGNRIVSFFKDEPVSGGFLNSFFLLIVSFFIVNNDFFPKKIFKLKLIIPIFLLVAIFLTGERSNLIKAILSLLIFYFLIKNISLKRKFLNIFIFIIFLFSIVNFSEYLKMRYIGQFYLQINSLDKIKSFSKNNLYIKHYYAGYQIFKKYPYMGVGNKNFGLVCFRKDNIDLFIDNTTSNNKKLYSKGVCSTHPHQIYFELLAEHGIIGTLIILVIIFSILFDNFKYFLINKNYIHLALIINLVLVFLPILPSGSFFGNFNSTLFWLNFSLMILFYNKYGGHDKN